MDSNVEEYLSFQDYNKRHPSDDTPIELYYERDVSTYRTSTLMPRRSWGDSQVTIREEHHYEEYL